MFCAKVTLAFFIIGTEILTFSSAAREINLRQQQKIAKKAETPESETNREKRQGIFSLSSGEACISPEGTEQGVCLSRQQCSLQGGRVVGSCGVFSTCCALSACDIRTNAKNSIFTNPSYSTSQPYNGLECAYTVEINNDNVCQMRIDLETFSLAQPTIPSAPELMATPAYACSNDIFQISNLQAFSEIIPPLCGENSGQHVYVRVNASLNSRTIRLSFKLADRTLNTNLTQAVWRIKVTQLECYNTLGLYKEPSIFSLGGSERTLEGGTTERQARAAAARDNYLIAPDGCLQYYPDRFGIIESFNYNRGLGPYVGNLHYAICFRRAIDVCGVKLATSKFQMGYANTTNYNLDNDCVVNPYVAGTVSSQDYLFIPQGESLDGLRGDKWCGISAQGQTIWTAPPGPLYVYVNTDNICINVSYELGFRFNYNVLNNCR